MKLVIAIWVALIIAQVQALELNKQVTVKSEILSALESNEVKCIFNNDSFKAAVATGYHVVSIEKLENVPGRPFIDIHMSGDFMGKFTINPCLSEQ